MQKTEIKNLIKELIEKTNVGVKEILISEDPSGGSWFNVELSEPHFYISREGEGLLALNHIVRRIVESKIPTQGTETKREIEVLIDINGFQKRKIDAVRTIAHMMAERARYFKSNIEVDPMSPFERRIVHEFLSNEVDLETESVGMGPTRRVVIKYIGSVL